VRRSRGALVSPVMEQWSEGLGHSREHTEAGGATDTPIIDEFSSRRRSKRQAARAFRSAADAMGARSSGGNGSAALFLESTTSSYHGNSIAGRWRAVSSKYEPTAGAWCSTLHRVRPALSQVGA